MPRIDHKTFENGLRGRDRLDFGTVRPRVQIPGPRLFRTRVSLFELAMSSGAGIPPVRMNGTATVFHLWLASRSASADRNNALADWRIT